MKLAMKNRPLGLAVVASFAALLIAATGTPIAAQQATGSGTTAQASRELPPTPSATFGFRLMQWSSTADRGALILFAGLSAAAATPTAATAEPSAAQASSPTAPLAGPRLLPEVRSILEGSATPSPAPPPPNTTIVISTLALVLIAVIVTILIVK